MQKPTLFVVLLLFCSHFAASQNKKVLFIGNSYTNYNNLPQLTYEVANSTGDGLIVDGSIVGGSSLEFHATNGFTENNISEDTWDFVIIQAGSIEGALTGSYFDTNVAPYAEQLVDIIKTNYACSQPVFYRTWGRQNGVSGTLCVTYPWICTYEGMDDALEINYRAMADANDGLIGPVGTVWRYLIDNPNTPVLYDADESHPALAGSYAAACTFYTILLRKDPTLITYDAGLDPAVAAQIRVATKVVVYDQLAYWKVGEFDPLAEFSYFENNGEVAFTNTSLNAETYAWDFGDTNTSTEENPIHTYSQIGDYNVELEVTKCGVSHTYNATVSVSALSLEDNTMSSLKLYPNPAENYLYMEGVEFETIKTLTLYNVLGKALPARFHQAERRIDISNLASGHYILEVVTTDGVKVMRKVLKD
jgi:PKD domain/Secretion system C-terminal sorting domain